MCRPLCFNLWACLQSLAVWHHVGSTALRPAPGDHAQPCVAAMAQPHAMSPACTMVLRWTPRLTSTPRTACLWESPSAFGPALPRHVSPTCGGLPPGATAPAACRTGLCPASVSGAAQQMLRYAPISKVCRWCLCLQTCSKLAGLHRGCCTWSLFFSTCVFASSVFCLQDHTAPPCAAAAARLISVEWKLPALSPLAFVQLQFAFPVPC